MEPVLAYLPPDLTGKRDRITVFTRECMLLNHREIPSDQYFLIWSEYVAYFEPCSP